MIDNIDVADRFVKLVIHDLREYAVGRKNDVARGAETPALAALLLEKYGYGLAKAASLLRDASDGHIKPPDVIAEVDALVAEIDPDWKAHRHLRWESRPADISLQAKFD